MRIFFVGIQFPVKLGYVYLTRGGGYDPVMVGTGIMKEGAALVGSEIIMGMSFKLWVKQGAGTSTQR